MICSFLGHSDSHKLNKKILQSAIEELIGNGVSEFYVGNHGGFDHMVIDCLFELKKIYRHISFSVVLAYLPTEKTDFSFYHEFTIYPEGIEAVHPKFAIERRNQWMIDQSKYCVCYINHTYGGAYKFVRRAKKQGLLLINLGEAEI